MNLVQKTLVILTILLVQGCQTRLKNPTQSQLSLPAEAQSKETEESATNIIKQQQFYSLLRQGMKLQALDKNQKQHKCESLKQDYQKKGGWQTAWLLVFFSDEKFSCITLQQRRKTINTLTNAKDVLEPLHWLNINQQYLLSRLSSLKSKNKKLKKELKHAKELISETTSKIEALKAIEDGINKKLNKPQQNAR